MLCTGHSGCFSQGKPAAIVRRYPSFFFFFFFCVQYFRVSIPPAVRPTLLRHMDMGPLTCAQIWVRAVHTKGDQAQTSLHKNGQKTEKLSLTLPRPGTVPRVFGFVFRLSNHRATTPVNPPPPTPVMYAAKSTILSHQK